MVARDNDKDMNKGHLTFKYQIGGVNVNQSTLRKPHTLKN